MADKPADPEQDVAQRLALTLERLDLLVSTSIEMALCLEYDPPVPTSLPIDEQAHALLANAVIALVNDGAALPYAGRPAKELVGLRLKDAWPDSAHAVLLEQFRAFVAQGYHHHHAEYEIPRDDGANTFVEVNRHGSIVDGHVVRSWHMSRDVTERVRREAKLRVSDERRRSYIEQSEESVSCWVYDPPLDPSLPEAAQVEALQARGFLVECNRRFYEQRGAKTASEILGRSARELHVTHPEVARAFVASGFGPHEVEIERPDRDGRVQTWVVRTSGKIEGGKLVQSWVTARDVTERKRADRALVESTKQLEQAQKLESLGLLAGGIAHDVNNLLASFAANLDFARLEVKRGRAPEPAFAAMDDAIARARDLTRRILFFSRPEEEQRREALSLASIVDECARLMRPTLPPSVRIAPRIDPRAPRVGADATQMHQVVMNLLQNAVQASEARGGEVTIVVEAATLAAPRPPLPAGRYARLIVRDHGAGMDARTRERMFDPFFTTKPRGTGLGLSVVHRIVAAHGGAITAQSEPDRGAELEVLLPALASGTDSDSVSDSDSDSVSVSVPAAPPAVPHVLFVDDEPRIAELTAHVLVHHGFRVTVQTSAALALDTFRASPTSFDVVVTDHTMPGMSGLELAEKIAALRPGVPILLASGQTEPPAPDVLRRAGVHVALSKPFPVSTLAERIRAAMAAASGT